MQKLTSGYLSKVTQLASNCNIVYYLGLWSFDSFSFLSAMLPSSGPACIATFCNRIWSWYIWIQLMNCCISVYSCQKSITENNYFSLSSLMKHFHRATENLHKYCLLLFSSKRFGDKSGSQEERKIKSSNFYIINNRSTKMQPRYFFRGEN